MLPRLLFTPIIILFLAAGSLFAQDVTMKLAPDYNLVIDGDSNVRDWDAKATKMEADFVLNGFSGENLSDMRPEHFKTLKLRIPVKDLDSDSRRLNRNLHDYLKSDRHPIITFELKKILEINATNNRADIVAEGVVNAAGKDHTITMNVTAEKNSDGSIRFSGSQDLLMTNFGIEPPTAMMGSIRARDEMTIIYNVRFTR